MSSLPLVFAALLLACVTLALCGRLPRRGRAIVFGATLAVALLPFNGLTISHFLRILCGDLSLVTVALLLVHAYYQFRPGRAAGLTYDVRVLVILIAAASLLLYPSALGLVSFDLYSEGYYPVVMTPFLMGLLALAVLQGWTLVAVLIPSVLLCYHLDILDSDNLWDYLTDPVLALYCLARVPRELRSLRPDPNLIQPALLAQGLAFLVFAVLLSRVNPDGFRYAFVPEDGFVEWSTAIILGVGAVVMGARLIRLRRCRGWQFLGVTGFVTLLCIFGMGEEISWGQRIFDIETPEYFLTYNKQAETGLHNLVFELNGREISVNKLIFGTGLAIGLLFYLAIMTPAYRRRRGVARFLDAVGVPMPQNIHIIGYLTVVAIVELLVDSSKRGEITEFAGSMVFLLNIWFPSNRHIYDSSVALSGADPVPPTDVPQRPD